MYLLCFLHCRCGEVIIFKEHSQIMPTNSVGFRHLVICSERHRVYHVCASAGAPFLCTVLYTERNLPRVEN